MIQTDKQLQSSGDALPLSGRHTPMQLNWIDEAFEWPAARKLARTVQVIPGLQSKFEFYDPEDDGPGEKFLRIVHPPAASRGSVLHEFGHAYCLTVWPDKAPDKGIEEVYCEAAALVPLFRLLFLRGLEDTDLLSYLHRWYETVGMSHQACVMAAEAAKANLGLPLHYLMERVLGGSPIPR